MNPRVEEIVNDSELVKEILRALKRRGITTFPIEQLREDFPTIDFALEVLRALNLNPDELRYCIFVKQNVDEILLHENVMAAYYHAYDFFVKESRNCQELSDLTLEYSPSMEHDPETDAPITNFVDAFFEDIKNELEKLGHTF